MVISNPFFVGFMGFYHLKKTGGREDNDAACMTYAKYNLEVLFTYFLKSVIIERNTVSFHALIQENAENCIKLRK